MPAPPHIRPLKAEDLKIVRFMLGVSVMGPLTTANSRAYRHPLTFVAWVALAAVMIEYMHWWPSITGPAGKWGVLAPIPAFAAWAVPIMFFFDWLHRPTFEKAVQKVLTAPDMQDPFSHYSRSPASSFYILVKNEKPIGLIALDATTPSSSDTPSTRTRSSKSKGGTTLDTAVIRHFHVDEPYNTTGVESDLLANALSRAFNATSAPQPDKVQAVSSALDPYKVAALRIAGFRPASHVDGDEPLEWKVGTYGWKNRWVEITREEWEAKRK